MEGFDMKQVRIGLSITLLWFFIYYNINRLYLPLNVEPIASFFVTFCFFILLLVPIAQTSQISILIGLLTLVNFFIRSQLGYEIGGVNLVASLLDIGAIAFTSFLALRIRHYLDQSNSNSNVKQIQQEAPDFETGQGQIYREIRRARRYERTIALLAISAMEELNDPSEDVLNKLTLRRETNHKTNDHLAKLLIKELRDYDVIAKRDNHFIALLPETNRESACGTIRRLESVAYENLGLKLKIGLATFPDEAVTFESLLGIAEDKMVGSSLTQTSRSNSRTANAKGILQM
jgi:hypothetical protein